MSCRYNWAEIKSIKLNGLPAYSAPDLDFVSAC